MDAKIITDTARCIEHGEHMGSQRHTYAECPLRPAEGDQPARWSGITLPPGTTMARRDSVRAGDTVVSSHSGQRLVLDATTRGIEAGTTTLWLDGARGPECCPGDSLIPVATRAADTTVPACETCEDYVDDPRLRRPYPADADPDAEWVHVENGSERCPGQGDDGTDDRASMVMRPITELGAFEPDDAAQESPVREAVRLLSVTLDALNAYRLHCRTKAVTGPAVTYRDDLRVLDELCDRSDLVDTPANVMARLIAEGARLPGDGDDASDAQWWSDTVADLLGEHSLVED